MNKTCRTDEQKNEDEDRHARIHIHSPRPIATFIKIYYCRKCKKRRKQEVKTFEWYGPSSKCLKCGHKTHWG